MKCNTQVLSFICFMSTVLFAFNNCSQSEFKSALTQNSTSISSNDDDASSEEPTYENEQQTNSSDNTTPSPSQPNSDPVDPGPTPEPVTETEQEVFGSDYYFGNVDDRLIGDHSNVSIMTTNISGAAHNKVISIKGSGFGSKAQAAPKVYDDVDNQPAYQGLSHGDKLPTSYEATSSPWAYNSKDYALDYVRIGRGPSAVYSSSKSTAYDINNNPVPTSSRHPFSSSVMYAYGDKMTIGEPEALNNLKNKKLYVTWWLKLSQDPGSEGGANKFIRIWQTSDNRISWTHHQLYCSDCGPSGWASWTSMGEINKWVKMEIFIDSTTGAMRTYIDGKLQHVTSSYFNNTSGYNGHFLFNNYESKHPDEPIDIGLIGFDHGNEGYKKLVSQMDEIYVDTTPQRVEMCESPYYQNCTHKETQLPVRWTDGEIQVQLKQGSFSSLSKKYLFIFNDKNQVVNADYGIEINP